MKTELSNRDLWYDGDSSFIFDESLLTDLVLGKFLDGGFVRELTPEIKQFNSFVPKTDQLTIKTSCDELDLSWKLPKEYKDLNLEKYLIDKLTGYSFSTEDHNTRLFRLSNELNLYKKLNLISVLHIMIYIVSTLEKNNIPWGVGRGSCVTSYVLHLIGVHDVDSVTYDLDINEFLREA